MGIQNFDIQNFSQASRKLLEKAQQQAQQSDHQHISPLHLLWAVLNSDNSDTLLLLTQSKTDIAQAKHLTQQQLGKIPKITAGTAGQIKHYLSQETLRLLEAAQKQSQQYHDRFVTTDSLIKALALDDADCKSILAKSGLEGDSLRQNISSLRGNRTADSENAEENFDALKKYCTDLTQLASSGKLDPVIGRDGEIRRVMQVLTRRTKNNPVLIGSPGVGKTAIAEGLAIRIINNDVPESLKDARLLSLDIGSLLAGAKFRGDFEERIKSVLHEVRQTHQRTVLFIDEMHVLIGAGKSEGAMDASNLLKPALARGELHCIGATTLNEYQKHVEKDAALARRFQTVYVEPPSIDDTISILRGLKQKYEVFHGVRISDQALVDAAKLSERYINDRFLPDKAIDLIDEAASRLRMTIDAKPENLDAFDRKLTQLKIEREALKKEDEEQSRQRLAKIEQDIMEIEKNAKKLAVEWQKEKERRNEMQKYKEQLDNYRDELEQTTRFGELERASELSYSLIPEVTRKLAEMETKHHQTTSSELVNKDHIAAIVSRWTGIPVDKMMQNERKKLLDMEDILHKDIIAQHEAVNLICRAVRRSRAGLKAPEKPIGSFLFIGPSGVGKTELAKSLAQFLFDDKESVLRIDMSEYMEKHSVSRLIGAPPGYVGYEEGGVLTEAVRRRPYKVILLDEIEKANTEIFNLLLQLLDDGRLTDSQGHNVDFSNTIIIMTSNLGADYLAQTTDRQIDENIRVNIMQQIRSFFKPEFLNRLDNIVLFHKLLPIHMADITRIQLRLLRNRLGEQNIDIRFDDAVIEHLAKEGYDAVYGARPLKRVIQRELEDKIADHLLADRIKSGDCITIACQQGRIAIAEINKVKKNDTAIGLKQSDLNNRT